MYVRFGSEASKMSTDTKKEASRCPRRLPIVRLDGVDYFIDERLQELRAVWNPHRRIEFHSPQGVAMLPRTGIVLCPVCGHEFGVLLAHAPGEEMVCPRCQTVVAFARLRFPRGSDHGHALGS